MAPLSSVPTPGRCVGSLCSKGKPVKHVLYYKWWCAAGLDITWLACSPAPKTFFSLLLYGWGLKPALSQPAFPLPAPSPSTKCLLGYSFQKFLKEEDLSPLQCCNIREKPSFSEALGLMVLEPPIFFFFPTSKKKFLLDHYLVSPLSRQ